MILQKIIQNKRLQLTTAQQELSIEKMEERLDKLAPLPLRSFREALLTGKDIAIIGEIKKASPSRGVFRADFDPFELARLYQCSGVQALSVLTERKFFQGNDQYLTVVRQNSSLPILRKDFIIDPWQIYQSRLLGADALLLIVSILSLPELIDYYRLAKNLGLDCLVEVHNRQELAMALEADVEIIGINNRDLKNFSISLQTTEKLMQHIPPGKIVISASGINSSKDLQYLRNLGVNGLLIGEALMRAGDLKKMVRSLRGEG